MAARPGRRSLLRLLGRRLPPTRGIWRVPGIRAQVAIGRDQHAVPYVEASSAEDAWYGLGFCHGQDRGFQLEILLRAGRGTLAELLGADALPIDRLTRTLGFARVARQQLPMLDPDVRGAVTAYGAGINAAAGITPRPHELAMLRATRTPWTAEDCLAFMGLQSLALAGNWDSELARVQILLADGPDALARVDPTYGPWLPAVIPVGSAAGDPIGRLAADLTRLRDVVGGPGASNAWAVAGERTASGSPILANDPHLAPTVPGPWYLAHLRTPEWEVAGCSFVGGPAFPTGHNGRLAWGITAGCTDSADLFWEEIDRTAGTARGPGGPEPIQVIREEIPVRGAPPEALEIVVTARGPIVTPALPGLEAALSLRATWLEPAPVRGLLDVVGARDVDAFRSAFAAWPGPALNVVFADAAGHIGWQLIGTLPQRRAGNGTVPLPAWDPEVGWAAEHLPFDAMPSCVDPDTGFVASANNAARSDDAAQPFLGVDWLDGYRAARIVEVLEGRTGWDVAAAQALQVDTTSIPWRELRELVLGAALRDERSRHARALLAAWDGDVAAGSAAASVFELMLLELAEAVVREAAPVGWAWALGRGFGMAVPRTSFGARIVSQLVAALRDRSDAASLVDAALAAAVSRLEAQVGPEPERWAWGSVRPLRLLHTFGAQRTLAPLFNVGPVAVGGDTNTVPQAGVLPLEPFANPAAIATHRTVVDLADPERSRYVIAGGQSGNPLSRHYDDLFELWQRGEGVPIAWSRDAVDAAVRQRLLLVPEG
jgi:penicillin amidase